MANIPTSSRNPACAACIFSHRKCAPHCREAGIFLRVISPQDYHTIFSVFGTKSIARILQQIPGDRYLQTLNSLLYEAKARIEDPVGGCEALITSLKQKLEELQSRVTALEARLDAGSSCINPCFPFAHPGGFLKLLTEVSVPEEILPENLLTITNLPVEVGPPEDGNFQIQRCPSQSSQAGTSQVVTAIETVDQLSPRWEDLVDTEQNFSSFDLDGYLNFDVDDLRILQPFLND